METVFNEIQHSVKNWWASLLLGIVYIIVALWLMFAPLSSYVALSIVFSISMLISGMAFSMRRGILSLEGAKGNCIPPGITLCAGKKCSAKYRNKKAGQKMSGFNLQWWR